MNIIILNIYYIIYIIHIFRLDTFTTLPWLGVIIFSWSETKFFFSSCIFLYQILFFYFDVFPFDNKSSPFVLKRISFKIYELFFSFFLFLYIVRCLSDVCYSVSVSNLLWTLFFLRILSDVFQMYVIFSFFLFAYIVRCLSDVVFYLVFWLEGFAYTQRHFFEILLNQTVIRL